MNIDFFAQINKKQPQKFISPPHSSFPRKKIPIIQNSMIIQIESQLPQLKCQKQNDHNCLWERYTVQDKSMAEPNRAPSKAYKFKLDSFQKKAIKCIQADQSVLVCAHTSAGKTAIAQYAISLSLKQNGRCIYTSPIKALSNQKYRDLKQQFKDVGLVTGDVTQNPSSSCIVMTTQILRSMIYRGSQVVRQVRWVIFDQCHYMRDSERGVVWEECIQMLPKAVKLLFLSATIANAAQFARWVCTIKKQPCSVVYTDYRPVPLQHYICPANASGISLVVDQKGRFLQDNFQKALQGISQNISVIGIEKKSRKGNQGSDLQKLLKLLIKKDLNPVIVFSFSKKDVEGYAHALHSQDFLLQEQKLKSKQIFQTAIQILSEQDRKLPQVQTIKPILNKGIGIHHGGLLPIIKEVIQILFQEGLVKVLFSTETFSMGLNMPARTVVFTNMRKFDGLDFRWMSGGQYIQMSGRAGRRGKDKNGLSIIMVDQKIQPQAAKNILKGKSDPLKSAFYINYNMLLSSIRLEDIDPEHIIQLSFLQFQNKSKAPHIRQKQNKLIRQMDLISIDKIQEVKEFYQLSITNQYNKQNLRKLIIKPDIVLQYLRIGRLVRIKQKQTNWGWGLIINWSSKKTRKKQNQASYIVDILTYVQPLKQGCDPKPTSFNNQGVLLVLSFVLQAIIQVFSLIVSLPQNITSPASKKLILETLKKIKSNYPYPCQLSIKNSDSQIQVLQKQIKADDLKLSQISKEGGSQLMQRVMQYQKKQNIAKSINQLQKQIDKTKQNVLIDDIRNMRRVLYRKDMLDQQGIVTLKGTVACQIGTSDQILLAQLLFIGFFNQYTSSQIAALLSSIVHDQKAATDRKFIKNPILAKGIQKIRAAANQLYKVFSQCRIQIDQEQYNDKIKQQLVQVTLQWCKGSNFLTISKMTDAFQGSIVRTLKRLDQLLKQLQKGARLMGNKELQIKFKESQSLLQRGIVFAASLYL